TFTCIMSKFAQSRSFIQGSNGSFTQGSITHGADIEYTEVIGLTTLGIPYHRSQIVFLYFHRKYGMVHPFVSGLIESRLHAECDRSPLVFGTLINNRASSPVEWLSVPIQFPEVMPQFGAYGFKEIANQSQYRTISEDGVFLLH